MTNLSLSQMEQVMNGKVAAKLWLQVTHVEQFVLGKC